MEAAGLPPREADVAPAPRADPTGGTAAGWTPADPGPLGLAGFAMTTFVLSMINANLVSSSGLGAVLALAIAYGGLAQLLAGMWEFRTGNTFGAVAFSSYGAFWISYYVLVHVTGSGVTAHGVALYLFSWGGFTTYMFFASLRTTGAVALVFLLLAITFILLGLGNIGGGHESLVHAGGGVGIATAVAAWYASFAAVINSTFGKVVLPVFPLRAV
jgi:uncharacterized protein